MVPHHSRGVQGAALRTWRPTTLWRPGRTGTASGGTSVECVETGETGFCKTTFVGKERIAAELARVIGVDVPEFRLGFLQGQTATVGVSMAFGTESLDLVMLRARSKTLFDSAPVQEAIKAASGLLALHAWLGTDDLKDEHLVIREEQRGGPYRVAAIDFSYSMTWRAASDPIQPPTGPPALTQVVDPARLVLAVDRIEQCDESVIRGIVADMPPDTLSDAERALLVEGLIARRPQVRAAMHARGWI